MKTKKLINKIVINVKIMCRMIAFFVLIAKNNFAANAQNLFKKKGISKIITKIVFHSSLFHHIPLLRRQEGKEVKRHQIDHLSFQNRW